MTNTEVIPKVPQEQTLEVSMLKLEQALLAPVISGELVTWSETVTDALGEFNRDWVAYVNTVLHAQYKQIARNDTDLLPRVEQLILEDKQLSADFTDFESLLGDLSQRAAEIEKDEVKASNQQSRVEREGIAILVRIKKQQSTANTWLQEAMFRDRGVGD